jgi:uncharacterized protein (TIGR02217 family)
MSFLETPSFPDQLAYGLVVGPIDSRTRIRTQSGQVTINRNWAHYLTKFDGTTTARTQAQRNEIDAFFRAVGAEGFRIKDWSDYSAGSSGVCTLISGNNYQLGKTYVAGSSTYTRKIQKPRNGTLSIAGGGSYTVDYTTGIVTRNSGAAPTTWTGEFDVPVQFDEDELVWQITTRAAGGLMFVADNLVMTEMRL